MIFVSCSQSCGNRFSDFLFFVCKVLTKFLGIFLCLEIPFLHNLDYPLLFSTVFSLPCRRIEQLADNFTVHDETNYWRYDIVSCRCSAIGMRHMSTLHLLHYLFTHPRKCMFFLSFCLNCVCFFSILKVCTVCKNVCVLLEWNKICDCFVCGN